MSETKPTYETVQTVRRWECSVNGHRLNVIESLSKGPTHVVCSNCGKTWPVGDPLD